MNGVTMANLSAPAAAFDQVARSYDEHFTHSLIGQAQRKQVWERLLQAFAPGDRVLEMNCGTGQDARFLAERGRRIVACDASSKMIEVATARTQREMPSAEISFLQMANESLGELPRHEPFDGAYSNFSGLNCVADLKPVARILASLVKPGGRVLLCLWSRICVWEIAWYLLHGKPAKAIRRLSGNSIARLGELAISVLYPTVPSVKRAFAPWFSLQRRGAVGLFVPPSYVEEWADKHEATFGHLVQMDSLLARWPVLRDLGDHVLLEFVRCGC
jgi:ubiquinone/menaquinone biosynthesis C-methylase UbiE